MLPEGLGSVTNAMLYLNPFHLPFNSLDVEMADSSHIRGEVSRAREGN